MQKLFKRLSLIILLIIICIPAIWLIKLVIIYPYTTEKLLRYQPLQQAEAIVVPSGDNCRVLYGLELLKKGYAKIFFSPGDTPNNFMLIKKEVKKLQAQDVTFESVSFSGSTFQDAMNTKYFVNKNHIHSILLVTSPYHSYRAYWIFRHLLPKEVNIISATVPLEQSDFNIEGAKIPGTWDYGVSKMEQKKFLGYYLLYSWKHF